MLFERIGFCEYPDNRLHTTCKKKSVEVVANDGREEQANDTVTDLFIYTTISFFIRLYHYLASPIVPSVATSTVIISSFHYIIASVVLYIKMGLFPLTIVIPFLCGVDEGDSDGVDGDSDGVDGDSDGVDAED